MPIHGKILHTRIQEFPISSNHVQQRNPAVHHERIRSGSQGNRKKPCRVSVSGGSHHIFYQL